MQDKDNYRMCPSPKNMSQIIWLSDMVAVKICYCFSRCGFSLACNSIKYLQIHRMCMADSSYVIHKNETMHEEMSKHTQTWFSDLSMRGNRTTHAVFNINLK